MEVRIISWHRQTAMPQDFKNESTLEGQDPWQRIFNDQLYYLPRQCIKKQRDHFANKVRIVKGMVFPVAMYVCESWTTKKAEHQRTDVSNCGAGE